MDYKQVNDYEVMYMIRENDDEAQDLLVKKYMPIVSKIASKYLPLVKTCGIEFDDLLQEGLIALNKAIIGYDDNSGVLFYTYVLVCVERHIITYCRRVNNKKNYFLNYSVASDDYFLFKDDKSSIDEFMSERFAEEDFVYCKNLFDISYSSIFELRYNGFTYKEISVLMDVSLGTVDARLSKIRKVLLEKRKFSF
ncbi:MAG: sigma-70 family RNA polymerase sigma factor [bacterium]|nr:sigma-70 family RNA polymerase sigma factor [bacterium]